MSALASSLLAWLLTYLPGRAAERAGRGHWPRAQARGFREHRSLRDSPVPVPRSLAALGRGPRVGRHRARLVPPLRRATLDPGRPPDPPPHRERRTARRAA